MSDTTHVKTDMRRTVKTGKLLKHRKAEPGEAKKIARGYLPG